MVKGKVDALLGIVFGDEGKGKVVDVFTPKYDVVARFAGGPNAGHTIIFEVRNSFSALFLQVFSLKIRSILSVTDVSLHPTCSWPKPKNLRMPDMT